ncbi:hypothetical protein [Methanolacinia petrolearia]
MIEAILFACIFFSAGRDETQFTLERINSKTMGKLEDINTNIMEILNRMK